METSSFYEADDGTNIWYGTVGDGPPLVLCDGLACDGFIWPYVIDEFCGRYTVVRWHYRGHGRSSDPADLAHVTVRDYCRDLRGIFEELDLDRAILAGHSMGVQVILQFAGLYPDRASALVPICGSYERPLDTFQNSTWLLDALPYIETMVDAAPEKLQSFWRTILPNRFWYHVARRGEIDDRLIDEDDFFPYLEHVAQMDLRVFVHTLKSLAEHSASSILERVEVPTLIIAAENDSFTPLDRSVEMHERIENSEMVVLPGAGHAGPLELPDAVNSAIESFLIRHGLDPQYGDGVD